MPAASVTIKAPAKINLYLGVHDALDAQGYHRVDSVMVALDLADTVTVAQAECLSVSTVPDVGIPQEQNTAFRAAVALGKVFGRDPKFDIRIEKHIPLEAGLGGPSADAAAAMRGICRLWGIDCQDELVLSVARSIGADVPFFLYDGPAYLSGRGDTMEELLPPLGEVPVALVKPESAGVSARDAYSRFDANPQALPPLDPLLAALRSVRVGEAVPWVENNLAPAACQLAPEISDILAWLGGQEGVLVSKVSGSGSCSFALCATAEDAERIAGAARSRGWWSAATSVEKFSPKAKVL